MLSNKEHFAEFHYRPIMCSQKWNTIFEEEVINHSVITVRRSGIRWMNGKNMLISHLGTVFSATFLLLRGGEKYNGIYWNYLKAISFELINVSAG